MNDTRNWPDDEDHQRRDADRRMKEQERESFVEKVAGTAEEYLSDELDGLPSDGDVVEQGNRVGLRAIWIFQGLQPEVEIIRRYRAGCERHSKAKCP